MKGGVVLSETESVCPECMATIPAQRVARESGVYLRKTCAEHGSFETVIWRGNPVFSSWLRPKTPSYPTFPSTHVERGCPFDCGLCPKHRQHTCTALIEVTRRCNLACTVCFADAGKGPAVDPSLDAIEFQLTRLRAASGLCNVQFSGGEPTLRDDLPQIVALARSMGFSFIQINTNGLRIANEPLFIKELKESGLKSIFLQFDSMDDAAYRVLRGRDLMRDKERAIEQCGRCGIGVVLVPTLVPGVNTDQIGPIIDFALRRLPTVRGVHFQPISYFGRFPKVPGDQDRVTLPDIITAIEEQTGGRMRTDHFSPPGCENALCSFHGNFVLLEDGELRSWTFHQTDGCGCKPAPAAEGAEKARRFVSQFWAQPKESSAPTSSAGDLSLGEWDCFLERARTHSLSISAMAFQDAFNLDLERLKDCCIHVVHADGRIVPFCAYNVTDRRGWSPYRDAEESESSVSREP